MKNSRVKENLVRVAGPQAGSGLFALAGRCGISVLRWAANRKGKSGLPSKSLRRGRYAKLSGLRRQSLRWRVVAAVQRAARPGGDMSSTEASSATLVVEQ